MEEMLVEWMATWQVLTVRGRSRPARDADYLHSETDTKIFTLDLSGTSGSLIHVIFGLLGQHHHLRSQKESFSIEELSMRLYDEPARELSTPSQLTTQDARSECHLDPQMALCYPANRTV